MKPSNCLVFALLFLIIVPAFSYAQSPERMEIVRTRVFSPGFGSLEKGPVQRIQNGKVKVRFVDGIVLDQFTSIPANRGFERLNLTAAEIKALRDIGIFQINRLNPHLEIREDSLIRVVSDAQHRSQMGKTPRSAEAAESMIGVERDMILRFPKSVGVTSICNSLEALDIVEHCEPFQGGDTTDPIFPNDPGFLDQWGFNNSAVASPSQVGNFDIDAPEAWELQQGNPAVVIAVVDSAPDLRHPDLYQKVWINTNELDATFLSRANALSSDGWPGILTFTDLNAFDADSLTQELMSELRTAYGLFDTNGNGYIDGEDLYDAFADGIDNDPVQTAGEVDDIVGWDYANDQPIPPIYDSHGTAVAGLAGTMTNNDLDTSGVGWNSRIMVVSSGFEWRAIDYAIKHGASVITSSLAPLLSSFSPELKASMQQLEPEGVVFSASLGNVDQYIDGTTYASSPYSIAVSNFLSLGIRAFPTGSSFSVNTDVAGPGNDVWSITTPTGTQWFGGTSGSNPVIAGILSLMVAERNDLTPEQLRQVLRQSAVDIPHINGDQGENTEGFDYYSGWGMANAYRALNLIDRDQWAEAKLTSNRANYISQNRLEHFHLIDETHDVTAFAGFPDGGTSRIELATAPGTMPVADGSWRQIHNDTHDYLSDEYLETLERNSLATGINTLRMTVHAGGEEYVEYGRIDVPHAYLDIRDYSLLATDFSLSGFAFHPDFDHYTLHFASGHDADPDNEALWTECGSAVYAPKEPVPSGEEFLHQLLYENLPIAAFPNGEVSIRLSVYSSEGRSLARSVVPIEVDRTVFPTQSGFPRSIGYAFCYGGPIAADLTGDGFPELIVNGQEIIYAFDHEGNTLPGWPVEIAGLIYSSPAVGDVTGDGLPNLVVRSSDQDGFSDTLYVFNHLGQLVSPFPLQTQTVLWDHRIERDADCSPVLADLDGDGDLEIILSGKQKNPSDPESRASAMVIQGDGTSGWEFSHPDADTTACHPVVGDMDGDGQLDVCVAYRTSREKCILIFRADGSLQTPEPLVISQSHITGMLLLDLDEDNDLEVVATDYVGGVYAFHHDGSVVEGWTNVQVPEYAEGNSYAYALSAGDLTAGNGNTPQVIVTYMTLNNTTDAWQHGLCVFDGHGNLLPGWEGRMVGDGRSTHPPCVFDVDNDGSMEVLIGGDYLGNEAEYCMLQGLNGDGSFIADNRFPIYVTGDMPRTPAVADLDRDGDLELSTTSVGRRAPAESFDLDSTVRPGAVAWGMQSHDPTRKTNYNGGFRILEPTKIRPSDVGAFNDADHRNGLLIRLRNELPHSSLSREQLSVRIGGRDAEVTGFQTVEGENWVMVSVPDQIRAANYLLEVIWDEAGIRRIARQADAVHYSDTTTPVDQILVMDRSGSMLQYDKYLAARTAGNFYVSARGPDDRAGLVAFHTESEDLIPGLLRLRGDDSANRLNIAGIISGIEPPSSLARTSIGEGLRRALEILPDQVEGRTRALVLLSDGLENTAPFWDQGHNPVRNLFEIPENQDVVIHTIALGPDADRDLHEAIAAATGGTARFVYLGNSLSVFARLSDAYKHVEDIVAGDQRLLTIGETLASGRPGVYSLRIPADATTAKFAVSFHDSSTNVSLSITRPDGSIIRDDDLSAFHGPTSTVIHLTNPVSGNYGITVDSGGLDTEILTTVSASFSKTLVASLTWMQPTGETGMTGHILAGIFSHGGFLHNQNPALMDLTRRPIPRVVALEVEVIAPDKSHTRVIMRDDGAHRDGEAYDGVFGVPYEFILDGGYSIVIKSTINEAEQTESMERSLGYFHTRTRDQDMDQILDTWEALYFPDIPVQWLHPFSDHDADGLNLLEEFRYGTHPLKYDSDADGLPDGFEVDQEMDPLVSDPRMTRPNDEDGDGMDDTWERIHFPATGIAEISGSGDPDGDGVENYAESIQGSDPNRSDSDGDGLRDDDEISMATPAPMGRTWSPQPGFADTDDSMPPVFPWWLIRLLLLLLILVWLFFIVMRRLRR